MRKEVCERARFRRVMLRVMRARVWMCVACVCGAAVSMCAHLIRHSRGSAERRGDRIRLRCRCDCR